MNILVTGGAGYIGSHAVRALKEKGHVPVVLDNLSRGHKKAVPKDVQLIVEDIHHIEGIREVLCREKIEGVMHLLLTAKWASQWKIRLFIMIIT